MTSIKVLAYAFKSKSFPSAIKNLLESSSGTTNIQIDVFDQNNISRTNKFDSVHYNHIEWDLRNSKFIYRNFDNFDYTLIVNGSPTFEKDWDIRLIDFLNQNKRSIISGNNILSFDNEIKFYTKYTEEHADNFYQTSWIRNTFLFGSTDILKFSPDLKSIKYLGEEEVLSVWAYQNDIKVFCAPTDRYKVEESDINRIDYIPFSIHHGYNRVIDIFIAENNIFNLSRQAALELGQQIGVDFSKINYLPFPTNDPTYDVKMQLDDVGEERFINTINSIY